MTSVLPLQKDVERLMAVAADAARRLAARDDVHVDLRHVVDVGRPVIVQIALLDPTILEGDLIEQRRAETVDDCALHLRFDGVRVDGDAAIHRAGDALDLDFAALGDLHLGNLRHVGREYCLHRDAAT